MKRFVVPPNWPVPPRRSWLPPRSWRPDPAWEPAPEDWKFWVNGKGKPVTGPIGRYGAPSLRRVATAVTAVVLFLSVNLWAATAIGLFGGDEPSARPTPLLSETSSATPSAVESSTPLPTTTLPTTRRPTAQPSETRTSRQPTRSKSRRPVPTRTTSTTPVLPSRPTTRPSSPPTSEPPTQAEILAEYCRRQGWDPKWCDPTNWPTRDPGRRRRH